MPPTSLPRSRPGRRGNGASRGVEEITREDLLAASLLVDDSDDDGFVRQGGRGSENAGLSDSGSVMGDPDRYQDLLIDDIALVVSDDDANHLEDEFENDDDDADLQRIRQRRMQRENARARAGSSTEYSPSRRRNIEEFSAEEAEMNRVILMSLQDSIGRRNTEMNRDSSSVEVSEDTVAVLLNMGFTRDQ